MFRGYCATCISGKDPPSSKSLMLRGTNSGDRLRSSNESDPNSLALLHLVSYEGTIRGVAAAFFLCSMLCGSSSCCVEHEMDLISSSFDDITDCDNDGCEIAAVAERVGAGSHIDVMLDCS
mmetsp:Transcript_22177/g.32382  ORF Transcript_22177/g.32382 Transcript_22177/m.32382 type:complete len:121 (+) Transcript_22177:441-803(+)